MPPPASPPVPPVASPPVPSPPPPPPPAPPASDNPVSAAEFDGQPNLTQINVLPAFEAGLIGEGVTVAVIDTGIDIDNPEFAGRIDPLSADLSEDVRTVPDVQDTQGHGTSVTGILAAAANGALGVGVAPGVDILSIRGNLEDDPDTDEDEALMIQGEAIVNGFELAAAQNVTAINLSLGSDDETARESFASIISFFAVPNDIVTVLSAGNEGDEATDPQPSAQAVLEAEVAGTAIAVGAVDANNNLTSFSNPAGIAQDFFIVAPGLFVPSPEIGGGQTPFSGTSASAPQVTGAVALIRAAWPQLSAAETVEIILDSATDLGEAGTDPIFGRGLLNIGAALEPSGQLMVPSATGSSVAVGNLTTTTSPVFGASLLNVEIVIGFDRFGRDFRFDLSTSANTRERFEVGGIVTPFVQTQTTGQRLGLGTEVQYRLQQIDSRFTDPEIALRSNHFVQGVDEPQTDFSFALTQSLGGGNVIAFSQGYSGRDLDQLVNGGPTISTLSRTAFSDAYLPDRSESLSLAGRLSAPLGSQLDFLISQTQEEGVTQNSALAGSVPVALNQANPFRADTTNIRFGLSKAVNNTILRFELGVLSEENTALGAGLPDALFGQAEGSDTVYTSVSGRIPLPHNFHLIGRYATGFTDLPLNEETGFVVDTSRVRTSQFALGLQKSALLTERDSFSISLSQPLFATGGAVSLLLPTDFDQLAEQAIFETVEFGLGDGQRPLDLEVNYIFRPTRGLVLDLNAAHSLTGFGGGQTAVALRLRRLF